MSFRWARRCRGPLPAYPGACQWPAFHLPLNGAGKVVIEDMVGIKVAQGKFWWKSWSWRKLKNKESVWAMKRIWEEIGRSKQPLGQVDICCYGDVRLLAFELHGRVILPNREATQSLSPKTPDNRIQKRKNSLGASKISLEKDGSIVARYAEQSTAHYLLIYRTIFLCRYA